ncbi:MAG: TIGR02147 family protein [Alphaproteobacteria bacterium]|nr:TIGR02147 family protein [Alphaproteobacteria bacterium]
MSDFDPFDHAEYRPLIRAWIGARPARSQTLLARRAGVSRSMVAMVLAGERDLPLASAETWADALELEDDGRAYLLLLVKADSPISLDLRRQARAQAAALRDSHYALRPTLRQAQLLGRWFVPVILELVRAGRASLDPEWLAARIWPEVTADEVDETVRALREAGIVTEEDGTMRIDHRPIATNRQLSDELSRTGRQYHHVQLEHASRALDEQPPETRWVGSLAVAVDGSRIEEMQQALHRFQLEVIEPFRADAGADTVVQVSLQLFARTR